MRSYRPLSYAALAFTLAAAPASAASSVYPEKSIRMIVGFNAGSATDIGARLVAEHIAKAAGVPVIVENRSGASGMIAAQAVAQAPADGYTMLATSQAQVTNPSFYRNVPFDTLKDFTPVSTLGRTALLVLAKNSLPADDIPSLVKLAKEQPGTLNVGAGNASSRVAAELFKMQTQTDIVHVPFNGMPQVITDLLGGHVDLTWADMVTGLPAVQAGKLKALGTTGGQRLTVLPDVPTLVEQDVAGHEVYAWTALYLPAGTPPERAQRLNALVRDALAAQQEAFERLGSQVFPQSLDEFAAFHAAELETWSRVAKAAGIQPE